LNKYSCKRNLVKDKTKFIREPSIIFFFKPPRTRSLGAVPWRQSGKNDEQSRKHDGCKHPLWKDKIPVRDDYPWIVGYSFTESERARNNLLRSDTPDPRLWLKSKGSSIAIGRSVHIFSRRYSGGSCRMETTCKR
jgi:hypothetical protein